MYNTIDDAVDLIRKANHILILTGAGISTSQLDKSIKVTLNTTSQVFLAGYLTSVRVMACIPCFNKKENTNWMTLNKCMSNFWVLTFFNQTVLGSI